MQAKKNSSQEDKIAIKKSCDVKKKSKTNFVLRFITKKMQEKKFAQK